MYMSKNYMQIVLLFIIFSSCKTIENKFNTHSIAPLKLEDSDYIFLEAESSSSDFQKWKIIKKGDENYVEGASNKTYLEFLGNEPITGKPNSPLKYHFTAPKDGNFKLMIMSSKRLYGVASDWCNDAFVKLSGNFESACNLKLEDLQKDVKILQDGNDKTPELAWYWASTAEKDRHVYNNFIYQLKKQEPYVLTISGRSMRFSIDYIILFDADKIDSKKAEELFKSRK